jgi:hypothetical protein
MSHLGQNGDVGYVPQTPTEQHYYQALFRLANPEQGDLGGASAVKFFKQSGVDTGFLKQVWTLSTPGAVMNAAQFSTALRYITMIQSGEFPISKERLEATKLTNLGLPKFSGVDIPPMPSLASASAPAPGAGAGGVGGVGGVGGAPSMGGRRPSNPSMGMGIPGMEYAINPQDHVKYHSLFLAYDKGGELGAGELGREVVMPVFQQSGLDTHILESIFKLSDIDRNNHLSR